jgi:hypothetical protein
MKIIQRFGAVLGGIIGGSIGIVSMALLNIVFNIDLSFAQVAIFGLFAGTVLGVFAGLVSTYYLLTNARKAIIDKIVSLFSRLQFSKGI